MVWFSFIPALESYVGYKKVHTQNLIQPILPLHAFFFDRGLIESFDTVFQVFYKSTFLNPLHNFNQRIVPFIDFCIGLKKCAYKLICCKASRRNFNGCLEL